MSERNTHKYLLVPASRIPMLRGEDMYHDYHYQKDHILHKKSPDIKKALAKYYSKERARILLPHHY